MAAFPADTSKPSPATASWDFVRGVTDWRLWAFLGLQDIRQRYRRSALGPLWLALGLGATILGIGVLYSQILKTSSSSYIPYLSISLLVWTFLSTVIIESTAMFSGNSHVITSVKIPYTSFVLRTITRNLIVAAHSIVVVVIAFVWFRYPVSWIAFAAVIGLGLLCLNLYWMSLLIGLLSARYRDIGQMVIYTTTIALFMTPVIWMQNQVRPGSAFVSLNPLAQMLIAVRAPIFDHAIPLYSFAFLGLMFVVGMAVTALVFKQTRRHLVYWI